MAFLPQLLVRFGNRVLPALCARSSFVDSVIKRLQQARPGELARAADPRLVIEASPQTLIRLAISGHRDEVIETLLAMQKAEVLDRLCADNLALVIAAVNLRAGGSFKYVGDGAIRVIVGAGPQRQEGWLATNIDQLNLVEAASWDRLFTPGSIDRLLGEHVLEHLSIRELRDALVQAYRHLRPGGVFRVAVPDAYHPSRYYYNLVKPGGWETPLEHLLFLDHDVLTRLAGAVGFEVRLLEYFDERGIFHGTDFSDTDGAIRRRGRNNLGLDTSDREVMAQFHASIPEPLRQQFIDRGISYTSLIADLVKPG